MKKQFIVLVAFLILLFLVYANAHAVKQTDYFSPNDETPEITEGTVIEQSFVCTMDSLSDILIDFNVSDRKDRMIQVSLYTDDDERTLIEEWNVSAYKLEDQNYHDFRLSSKIKDCEGKSYVLCFSTESEDGTYVTLPLNTEGLPGGYSLNGVAQEGASVLYSLKYYKPLPVWSVVLVIAGIIATAVLCCFISRRKWKLERAFLIMWLVCSTMMALSSPVGRVPDEATHFCRILSLSYGDAVSEQSEEGTTVGSKLPLPGDFLGNTYTFRMLLKNADTMTLTDKESFFEFPNTSAYSPVTYLPQVLGVFLARHITSKIILIMYAGRIFNWLAITLLLYYSVKKALFGKEIIMLIALMPMNVQESFSMAPDGMVTALIIVMFCYILNLRYGPDSDRKMSAVQIAAVYILAVSVSLIKVIYLPFCLAFLMIPWQRFGSKKWYGIHLSAAAVLTAFCSLKWLKTAGEYMVYAGTDSTLQIQFILTHPFNYLLTICRTLFPHAGEYLQEIVGLRLGYIDVEVTSIIILVYLYFFIRKMDGSVFHTEASAHHPYSRLIIFSVIAVFFLNLTALYIQWTPVYENVIEGIQGRYFIPLLFPLYVGLWERAKKKPQPCTSASFGMLAVITAANVSAFLALIFSGLSI